LKHRAGFALRFIGKIQAAAIFGGGRAMSAKCPVPLLLGLGFWMATSLLAGQFMPLSLEQLTQKAQVILCGTVRGKSCHQDEAGRIYTKIELQITEVWKGRVPANPFSIVHSGGAIGRRRTVLAGQADYAVGEEVVAFLVLNRRGEGVTLGLAQGKFRVWNDPATGEKRAQNLFHGGVASENQAVQAPGAAVTGKLSLAELKRRVKAIAQ
jgi:hypothetical protein